MTAIDTAHLLARDWWAKLDRSDPAACWLWPQSCGSHGYGQTWDGTTVRLAHRVAWTLTHGPIPAGLTIDHECRTLICCNPRHLRLRSNQDNGRDNGWADRPACPQGHPYDAENTAHTPRGHRYCRTCNRDKARRHYHRLGPFE